MSGLGDLAAKLQALAKVPELVTREARARIEVLAKAEFSAGRDPYGRQWAPLKAGGRSTLTKTGALRNSLRVISDGTAIKVTVDFPVVFHQGGTAHMPARPVLSVGVMPPAWAKAIDEAFAAAMKGAM